MNRTIIELNFQEEETYSTLALSMQITSGLAEAACRIAAANELD
jgi:hypothetical protein